MVCPRPSCRCRLARSNGAPTLTVGWPWRARLSAATRGAHVRSYMGAVFASVAAYILGLRPPCPASGARAGRTAPGARVGGTARGATAWTDYRRARSWLLSWIEISLHPRWHAELKRRPIQS